jgi:hypothetical protein
MFLVVISRPNNMVFVSGMGSVFKAERIHLLDLRFQSQ